MEVWKALTTAIQSGRISKERLELSLNRIYRLRSGKNLFMNPLVKTDILKNPFHQHTAKLIRRLGLAVFKIKNLDQLQKSFINSKTNVQLNAYHDGLLNNFKSILKSYSPKSINAYNLSDLNNHGLTFKSELNIIVLRNSIDRRTFQALWKQLKIEKNLDDKKKVVVISMDSPRLLVGFEEADMLLCTFNNDAQALYTVGKLFTKSLEMVPAMLTLKDYY